MDGHRTAERRSLAYHRAIAGRLRTEPVLVERARARVDEWITTGGVHPRWARAWRDLLAGDLASIETALIAPGAAMIAMRQVSPFAGALGARERWALWRATRDVGA